MYIVWAWLFFGADRRCCAVRQPGFYKCGPTFDHAAGSYNQPQNTSPELDACEAGLEPQRENEMGTTTRH